MKKKSAMFLSISAVLAINAFAPHMFWEQKSLPTRAPSSLEEDRTEDLAIKEKEKEKEKQEKNNEIEAAKNVDQKQIVEEKLKSSEEVITCQKEDKSEKLEAEMKKLLEDKEKILKELEDLKKANVKIESPVVTEKEIKHDKKDKDIFKADQNNDLMGIMSQLTSLMISQQQQQMMMMSQMFSMFSMNNMQHTKNYNSPYSIISEYMSPYSISQTGLPYEKADYSLIGPGRSIGIGYGEGLRIHNLSSGPGLSYNREPSSQIQIAPMERNYLQQQFRSDKPMNHDGFDFGGSSSLVGFDRINF